MTDQVDAVVIGAGLVGLATARALGTRGREPLVLESQSAIGMGNSSRNSEVIHAGIYYPPGSLKARACVEGRRALYDYAASRGIAHRRTGKLIVATDDQELAVLDDTIARAAANGLTGDEALRWMTQAQISSAEPALSVKGAIFSPSTGIIDSHGLMLAYQADIERTGGGVVLQSPVRSITPIPDGFEIDVGGAEPATLHTPILINAAGLGAWALADKTEGLNKALIPPRHLSRGCYFTLTGRTPFSHLVYPVPQAASLGVHVTLDLAGRARFGPDHEWIDQEDYSVNPARADEFYGAIRRYWPGLPDGALSPAYAGIRPKIQGPGDPAADFMIQGPAEHGLAGLVNLFGIESPGLTSSLALGEMVAGVVRP